MSKINKECLWPEKKLPTEWLTTIKKYPCPKCKRFLTDVRGQNSIIEKRDNNMVFFRCKSCSHQWSLPRLRYEFPNEQKVCDSCGCVTEHSSTVGRVQYRKCPNYTCRKTVQIIGKPLKK